MYCPMQQTMFDRRKRYILPSVCLAHFTDWICVVTEKYHVVTESKYFTTSLVLISTLKPP